jgi:hypothetical protein
VTYLTVPPKQKRKERREKTKDKYKEDKNGKEINKTRRVKRASVGKQQSGER